MSLRKVLVVDDEPHILLILEKVLKRHECDVHKAENGEAALKKLKNDNFDIVILDLMMPGISGIEVCRQVRGGSKTKDKPIVILTADRDEKDKAACVSLGISDYITKPFSPKKLANRIKEILEKYPPIEES
jgi:two-component system alkaline phosphatase synthesis response regulator PhoP